MVKGISTLALVLTIVSIQAFLLKSSFNYGEEKSRAEYLDQQVIELADVNTQLHNAQKKIRRLEADYYLDLEAAKSRLKPIKQQVVKYVETVKNECVMNDEGVNLINKMIESVNQGD